MYMKWSNIFNLLQDIQHEHQLIASAMRAVLLLVSEIEFLSIFKTEKLQV